MKAALIAVIANIFGSLLTALGYILIKRSHSVASRKKRHNFLTIEFWSGFFTCGIATVINVGK